MTTIDTPAGISHWYFMSAVSQLGLELKTGLNYYGKTSVYKGIRQNMMPDLPPRATVVNKCVALATLLHEQPASPVIDLARKTLDEKCAELGIAIIPA